MAENNTTNTKNAIIEELADVIERRDNTEAGHVTRVKNAMRAYLEAVVASGLYKEQSSLWNIDQIVLASLLHDVGKGEIDDMILRKPGKLDPVEFEVVKRHTLLGGEIIKKIQKVSGKSEFLNNAFTIAMYHHEKWDGTGYPKGLAEEEIPLLARLMAIIDVYDALVSERPYKKPFTHKEAMDIIQEAKGSSFAPALTDVFLSIADKLK
ncbi:MAG: HD domain-containing protein [Treponema sp.]|jgi:putative two-component system response regulator|nr:HD domain-containing protein [Treponema sp.]